MRSSSSNEVKTSKFAVFFDVVAKGRYLHADEFATLTTTFLKNFESFNGSLTITCATIPLSLSLSFTPTIQASGVI